MAVRSHGITSITPRTRRSLAPRLLADERSGSSES